ncbi:MAG: hypothetical protein AAFP90_16965 [Planctomycetota bacterium]
MTRNTLLGLFFLLTISLCGCGRENQVIEPGEEYQPTETEQANQERYESMREEQVEQ